MKRLIFMLAVCAGGPVFAHEGHGDTLIHALAHFFESHGPYLWLAGAAAAVIGVLRFHARKGRQK